MVVTDGFARLTAACCLAEDMGQSSAAGVLIMVLLLVGCFSKNFMLICWDEMALLELRLYIFTVKQSKLAQEVFI